MGRPLNKKNFGDPTDPGLQLVINIKGGTSFILNQKGSSRFTADDDGSGSSGLVTLVNEQFPDDVGEASIVIRIGDVPGENATATSTLKIVNATLTDPGNGYQSSDTLTFSEGTFSEGALITVNSVSGESSGPILSFTVTDPGVYTVIPPSGNAQGGSGSEAAFALSWGVGGVNVTLEGTGYVNPPIVQFSGGEGAGAAGTSVLEDDGIGGITVTVTGTGYDTSPTVTIIRAVTERSIEMVRTLHNRTARTFQGNSYKWSPGAGFTGDDNAGNITST